GDPEQFAEGIAWHEGIIADGRGWRNPLPRGPLPVTSNKMNFAPTLAFRRPFDADRRASPDRYYRRESPPGPGAQGCQTTRAAVWRRAQPGELPPGNAPGNPRLGPQGH